MKEHKNLDFNKVKYLTIDEENQDQRLDNFMYNFLHKQVARSFIQEIIRTGQVRVNKARVKHNYHLAVNDYVRIPPIKVIPTKINSTPKADLSTLKLKKLKYWEEMLAKSIILENKNIIILNKPPGLAVHGGSMIKFGLIDIIRKLTKEDFVELVHRLDRDTSGCIILAKKRSYLKKLHLLIKENKITKIYNAVVKGNLTSTKVIDLPLKKIRNNANEHVVKVASDGSYAKTICIPITTFKLEQQDLTLVKVKLLTGKTHQIRVHLASIGLPILNDDKYGDRNYNSKITKLGLTRMFLHAKSLKFACPVTQQVIACQASYDQNLTDFLLKLGVMSE